VVPEAKGNRQRNELWHKLATRHLADPGMEEEKEEEGSLRQQCTLYRHGQHVNDLDFHPELPVFASCSDDQTVRLWERNPVCTLLIAAP